MSLNPRVTDQGNKVRLDWTPDLTGQGYRLYVDGVAVSRTFKPDASSTTFAKPDSGPHKYGVRKMDVVDVLEEATWPEPPPPPPPPPPTGCTQTISSGLAAAIQGAAAGAVICLQAGNYGSINLSNVTKASEVLIRPVAGAAVVIGSLNLHACKNLHFSGDGGSMKVNGMGIDGGSGEVSSSLTFDHIVWTSTVLVRTRGNGDQKILIDSCTFDGLNVDVYEGRLTVFGHNAPQPCGVVISNNHFGGGGCSDGIQLTGGTNGVQIGPGNIFDGIVQGNCSPVHADAIQPYDCDNTLIVGNWIKNCSTQIMAPDDSNGKVTVRGNVIEGSGYPQLIVAGAAKGWVVEHNVFLNDDVAFRTSNQGTGPSGNVCRDNVFANGASMGGTVSGFGTNDHNLNSGRSGPGEITGTPIFVGGSKPTSYDGFRLAPGSPGKGAASDGSDMGIR